MQKSKAEVSQIVSDICQFFAWQEFWPISLDLSFTRWNYKHFLQSDSIENDSLANESLLIVTFCGILDCDNNSYECTLLPTVQAEIANHENFSTGRNCKSWKLDQSVIITSKVLQKDFWCIKHSSK